MDYHKIKNLSAILALSLFVANVAFGQAAPYVDVVSSSVTPTVTAATTNYTIGDAIGSTLEFASLPAEGVIQSVVVSDAGAEAKAFQLCLFDTVLAATVTDNAAFDPTDADILNLIGCQTITDFQSFSDNGTGTALQMGLPYKLALGNTIYGVLIDKTGGYYFDATSALTVTLTVYR